MSARQRAINKNVGKEQKYLELSTERESNIYIKREIEIEREREIIVVVKEINLKRKF